MARWAFVATTTDGRPVAELSAATSRKITFDVDAPATATFTIPGRHDQAAVIDELLTDIVAVRDADRLFRGRVGASGDTLDADHQTDFAAVDYRGMLARRILWDPQTFAAEDQIDIAWDLIDYTQGLTGGNLGITRDADPSGVTRDRDYDAGLNVGTLLDELGRLDQGFDWEIDANLIFHAWYPSRGTDRDLALTYFADAAGTVAAVKRSVDPANYADAVRATGADTTTPAVAEAADLADRTEGRFDFQVGDPDIQEDTTLTAKAAGTLADRQDIEPGYTFTLNPGLWRPADLWLGDTTRVVVRSGRLDVNTFQRVRRITVTLDDSGAETVEVQTGAIQRTLTQRLHATDTRLAALERR